MAIVPHLASKLRTWLGTGAGCVSTVLGIKQPRSWTGAPDTVPGPRLDALEIDARNQRNRTQTCVLTGGMTVLLLVAAALLAGGWGVAIVVGCLVSMVLLGPRIAPATVMATYRAEAVSPANGRTFLALVEELSRRAGLPRPPALFIIPSPTLNAFAVGTPEYSAIALTGGLVRRLQMRELAGVLAHEISHIRNGDLWIMGLADGVTQIARILSWSALALMALNLVSVYTGVGGLSWLGLFLLYLAPFASSLMQQALSRTREFDADLDAVTLTGDAQGLAAALAKIEAIQGRPWEDLVFGARRVPQPSLLRSHPTTAERLASLEAVMRRGPASPDARMPGQSAPWPPLVVIDGPLITGSAGANSQRPRYRWLAGVWY